MNMGTNLNSSITLAFFRRHGLFVNLTTTGCSEAGKMGIRHAKSVWLQRSAFCINWRERAYSTMDCTHGHICFAMECSRTQAGVLHLCCTPNS